MLKNLKYLTIPKYFKDFNMYDQTEITLLKCDVTSK